MRVKIQATRSKVTFVPAKHPYLSLSGTWVISVCGNNQAKQWLSGRIYNKQCLTQIDYLSPQENSLEMLLITTTNSLLPFSKPFK